MRRALALATATAAWVFLIQVASIAIAPPRVVELSAVDVSAGRASDTARETLDLTLTPANPATILLPGSSGSSTTTAAPTTTTAALTTTAAPVTTTTAAPPATTTTGAPPATTTTTAVPATTTTAATVNGNFSAEAESDFISKINSLRSSVGVAGLSANGDLNNYARWWAKQMAESGNFSHSDIGSLLGPWSVVGENIGYGPSVDSVFNALVNSSGHYNNMVDARFTSVGAGAFVDSAGRIWTAHVFGG